MLRKNILRFSAALCIAAALIAVAPRSQASVRFRQVSVNSVDLSIIEIHGEDIVPVLASGADYPRKIYTDESFESMAERSGAAGAINGCFFDTVSDRPIGDLAFGGKPLIRGNGWAYFGITYDGGLEFSTGTASLSRKDWKGYRFGLSCIPLLVKNGVQLIKNSDDLRAAGFRDPVVFMKMKRAAIATTQNGKVLFVTSSPAYMQDFAAALIQAGAQNALGLDGGAATGMYFKGNTIESPSMALTHIFVVKEY